ncbi:Na+/H+ antiporter [Rhizocola hellebori]|uniref:Na+/H+ antiporter n=1 Tax=Rhizocola hellebori TaxID=1392758 RepID=A0A8J3Q6N5_9ACTN|nr:Na+/H+ antiporter [Rhizocola hellebori]GIH04816.1 Na+/H+ antiporter [Rhizocola hellebori]
MEQLFVIVGLVAVVIAVSALARKIGLLSPILLVVCGLALAFVPGFPVPALDPEVILIGVLPPLLYVAAVETSVPAFRYNLRSILLLAVGLVIFTAAAVGFVVHALVPGVPLAICMALGAAVAPTDAVAATAIARRIGLPSQTVTLLEGESLVNDATALVIFRVAIAATLGHAVSAAEIGVEVLLAAGGGILVGVLGAVVFGLLHRRTTDPLLDNTLSLITPFAVMLVAEWIEASGFVAVVVTGLALGHRWPTLMSAASRLQMGAFWKMVRFLLEGLVFLLLGLQLRSVISDLNTPWLEVVAITAAVLGTVVLTRFGWVLPSFYLTKTPMSVAAVTSWAGMRGVITLATALALPLTLQGGVEYPRELFIWLAFAVIVGTLVGQGLTMPAFARWVKPPMDDPTKEVLAEAAVQHQASAAARAKLDELAETAPADVVERLRSLTQYRANKAWERLGSHRETPTQAYVRLRQEMLDAEREVFRAARDEGRITEAVLVRAQRDMDLEESLLERSEE